MRRYRLNGDDLHLRSRSDLPRVPGSRPGVLTAQHRPPATEKSGERGQAGGQCDPRPHLAGAGNPGNAGDLAGGEAAGGIHAERKDSCLAARVVAEPGPEHLGGYQGKEPRHGQAPKHQRAGSEGRVLLAELPQRAAGFGDSGSGDGGDGQRAASDPLVAVPVY